MALFVHDRLRLGQRQVPACLVLPSFPETLPLIARCPDLPHCHFCGFTLLVHKEVEPGPLLPLDKTRAGAAAGVWQALFQST